MRGMGWLITLRLTANGIVRLLRQVTRHMLSLAVRALRLLSNVRLTKIDEEIIR